MVSCIIDAWWLSAPPGHEVWTSKSLRYSRSCQYRGDCSDWCPLIWAALPLFCFSPCFGLKPFPLLMRWPLASVSVWVYSWLPCSKPLMPFTRFPSSSPTPWNTRFLFHSIPFTVSGYLLTQRRQTKPIVFAHRTRLISILLQSRITRCIIWLSVNLMPKSSIIPRHFYIYIPEIKKNIKKRKRAISKTCKRRLISRYEFRSKEHLNVSEQTPICWDPRFIALTGTVYTDITLIYTRVLINVRFADPNIRILIPNGE